RARREPVVRAAVPVAVAVWLLVSAAATGPGLAVLDALVDAVPAAGLVRDTQKFVALALPATVLALAVATRALARWLRPAGAAVLVAAVAVASVPDAPAALWSALRPVTYGPGWAEVERIVAGGPGDVLVLTAGSRRCRSVAARRRCYRCATGRRWPGGAGPPRREMGTGRAGLPRYEVRVASDQGLDDNDGYRPRTVPPRDHRRRPAGAPARLAGRP